MNYDKIKSPEKLKIEIIKAKKIKSYELQFIRMKLIQERIYDLIKTRRKVKLLSTEGDKRILAVLEEMYKENKIYLEGFKKNQAIIKNIISNKIKPDSLRIKTDYIEWLGEKEELVKLMNGLIEKKYIIDMPKSKINTAIKNHFYIGDFLRVVKEKSPKIKWGKTKPLLVYLFEYLYKKGFLNTTFYDSRYTYISDHFISKEGNIIENKKLRDKYEQGIKTQGASYSDAPIGYKQLEEVVEKALNAVS